MDEYFRYYEENKSEILKVLKELNYTPHTLIEESSKDGISVFEYIYLLNNI
jgi:hypothetical protein